MATDSPEEKLVAALNFRVTAKMSAEVEQHRQARRLHKEPDAARELMQAGIDALREPAYGAIAELRALGADPLMALRDKIAEVQRDQALSLSSRP